MNNKTTEPLNQIIGQYVVVNASKSMYQYLKPIDVKNGVIRVRFIPKPLNVQNISTIMNYD